MTRGCGELCPFLDDYCRSEVGSRHHPCPVALSHCGSKLPRDGKLCDREPVGALRRPQGNECRAHFAAQSPAVAAIASRAAAVLARALAMSAGRTPKERIRKLMMGPTFQGDGTVVVVL